jgi:hypothetical protein
MPDIEAFGLVRRIYSVPILGSGIDTVRKEALEVLCINWNRQRIPVFCCVQQDGLAYQRVQQIRDFWPSQGLKP